MPNSKFGRGSVRIQPPPKICISKRKRPVSFTPDPCYDGGTVSFTATAPMPFNRQANWSFTSVQDPTSNPQGPRWFEFSWSDTGIVSSGTPLVGPNMGSNSRMSLPGTYIARLVLYCQTTGAAGLPPVVFDQSIPVVVT